MKALHMLIYATIAGFVSPPHPFILAAALGVMLGQVAKRKFLADNRSQEELDDNRSRLGERNSVTIAL